MISVGGVETAADVRERLDAGATLVQGYTAFLYRGPLWAREINRGLVRLATSELDGKLPALDLRLGQTHHAQLERAHRGVPTHLFNAVSTELVFELATHDEPENDRVADRDDEERPQRHDADALNVWRGDEGQKDDEDHERNHDFADVEARVYIVTHVALLWTAITHRQELLVTRGHADSRLLALELSLRASATAASLRSPETSGCLRAASFSLRVGVAWPLPVVDSGVGSLSVVLCVVFATGFLALIVCLRLLA